jgi:hypothetical protein
MLTGGLLTSKVQKSAFDYRIIVGRKAVGVEVVGSFESRLSESSDCALEDMIKSTDDKS